MQDFNLCDFRRKIMKKICVIGSINMDLVIETEYPPVMGETVFGKGFKTVPGGKGANQAIAAAKLGNDVSFIGAVGEIHSVHN